MLNGGVLGQKFYAARNPRWTKLGKAGKPMMGLRSNGQVPGPYGHGGQAEIRRAFAQTAIGNFGTTGLAANGMPNIALAMAARFPKRVSPDQQAAARRAKAQAAHAAAQARWGGVPMLTAGGSSGRPGYPGGSGGF